MKLRTHRLRRVAAAAALGVGTVGGVVGFAVGGSAGAAAIPGATIHASGAPSVVSTGSGQKAGTLTLTLPATGTGGAIKLKVAATTGTVKWATDTVASSGGTATGTAAGSTLTITAAKATGTAETITVTGITYTTTTAHGTVTVTPTATVYTFKPTAVVNAVAPAAPATPPATTTLTATSTPSHVTPGKTGQAATTWTIAIKGAKGTAWAKTDAVTVTVFTPTGTNCSTADGFVLFTGTPSAKVTGTKDTSTTPSVSTTASHGTDCAVAANHNQLTVTFTNTGSFTATTGTITITVSGIKYDVGGKTTTGDVEVGYVKVDGTAVAKSGTAGPTGPSNADVTKLYVTANTPVVHVAKKGYDTGISPVKIFSDTADAVSGYVCLSLSSGHFNPAATATVKQTGGATGKVTPKVSYETSAGAATTKATTTAYAMFHVLTEVTKTLPVTYSVDGLKVDATTVAATVTVKEGATSKCTATTTTLGTAKAYTIATSTTQVYGATPDATAAAEFDRTFPYGTGTCPGTRAAVVATTKTYQDALSSQFLAQDLRTGTLLTPTTSLSQATATTLRRQGITTVYLVGGPLAITTAVSNDIAGMHVYNCGGTTLTPTTTITVHRIYGTTQYATAASVAEFVGSAGTASFLGAYTTPSAPTNSTGGNGRYNDTAGKGSVAPSLSGDLKTAILASGQEFQDAQSASAFAYHTGIPLLLTPATSLSTTAVTAIEDLHVKQVVLMGGQLAVTNTVEAALVAKTGVSVLRVAGKDYTDTARELAKFEVATAPNGLGWTIGGRILVARGNGFTDGLAGAVLESTTNSATGAVHPRPLLLTETPTVVGTYLTTFLKITGHTGIDGNGAKKITAFTVLGGPLAVSPAAIAAMETDLKS